LINLTELRCDFK